MVRIFQLFFELLHVFDRLFSLDIDVFRYYRLVSYGNKLSKVYVKQDLRCVFLV